MEDTTWLPIGKRIFSHEELCADSSIRVVGHWDCQDWSRLHSWYKAVNRMPLQPSESQFIKDFLLRPAYFAAYELDRPWVVTFRWPSGELKFFLISADGNLVEPQTNSIWDKLFSFFSHSEMGELMGMRIPAPVSRCSIANWVWPPASANYSHFFFDAFAQMAMAQEKLSSVYLGEFYLPVDAGAPSWQEELMQKLLFRCHIFPGDNALGEFGIFRLNKILLPVVSHQSVAMDWLRGFLAKSFHPSPSPVFFGNDKKIIMVTRYDARRERIQNITAIEELVVDLGGIVLDASGLSCSEKIAVFQDCSVCIAESSGCMNSALFAPENSRLISLLDPSLIDKKYFLVGGWPYFTGYAHRARFVVGTNGSSLPGSPVGSSSYSVELIKRLVLEVL